MDEGATETSDVPDTRVDLVAADPTWARKFEHERRRLAEVLPRDVQILHVGSTSVPGLAAKPTIDILAIAPDIIAVRHRSSDLALLGYQERPDAFVAGLDRLFFRKVRNGRRTHHLHVVRPDTPEARDMPLLRDYLEAHPDAAAAYATAKRQLAVAHAHDRMAYVRAKEPIVERLLGSARQWSSPGASPPATPP